VDLPLPAERCYVLIMAPHTSYMDAVIGLCAKVAMQFPARFMGKKEAFTGPQGWLLRQLGGFPVDRESPDGIIEDMARRLRQNPDMILALAPEGTRKKTEFWRSGFYRIALAADVPVGFGYIDARNKRIGICPELYRLTGDPRRDMDRIRCFYRGIQGFHPEGQGPVLLGSERPQSEEHTHEKSTDGLPRRHPGPDGL
jgi:hypothetical protein